MGTFRIGSMMLAIGLVVGSGATVALRQPAAAIAGQSMAGMSMKSQSKSAGDTEMNAAMDRMSAQMSSLKLTGVQDRDFMSMMIPHHMSAVDMAKIELRRGTRPELKTLARDIIKSQDQEIGRMQGWLKAWYAR